MYHQKQPETLDVSKSGAGWGPGGVLNPAARREELLESSEPKEQQAAQVFSLEL